MSCNLEQKYDVSPFDIVVIADDVASAMGLLNNEDRTPFADGIKDAIHAVSLSEILCTYRVFDSCSVDEKNGLLSIEGLTFNTGNTIARGLKDSSHCAVFACTAGNTLETLAAAQMKQGNYPEGFAYDCTGSLTAEAAADHLQRKLESAMLQQGLHITQRYSPGYCGWNVDEQQKLFQLLPDNPCGITLSESSLMHPIKSVSGIIGIGENVDRLEYGCALSDMKKCGFGKR